MHPCALRRTHTHQLAAQFSTPSFFPDLLSLSSPTSSLRGLSHESVSFLTLNVFPLPTLLVFLFSPSGVSDFSLTFLLSCLLSMCMLGCVIPLNPPLYLQHNCVIPLHVHAGRCDLLLICNTIVCAHLYFHSANPHTNVYAHPYPI